MTEFLLRPENGHVAETTLIGFASFDAFLNYVKQVGEVKIVYEDRSLVMETPRGK